MTEEDLINRDNYHDVLKYLDYCREVRGNSKGTLDLRWNQIRHLIEWAVQRPLATGASIRPTFPEYLTTAANARTKGEHLAYQTQSNICRAVQAFYGWAKGGLHEYRRVDSEWIETLRPRRQSSGKSRPEGWAIEDVRTIASFTPPTLTLERIQAAIVLLFLSAMRVAAFVTLPIKAVNLDGNEVKQWPEWGVRTKNLKRATTSLLQIPDLLEVVQRWDRKVRAALSPDDQWFAHLKSDGSGFLSGRPATDTRTRRVRRDMRAICELAGIEYKSPHALRHGFALYGKANAKDIGDLQAISRNMMHESLTVTDQVYGVFGTEEIKDRLAGLGQNESADVTTSALLEEIAALRRMVQRLVDQNEAENGS